MVCFEPRKGPDTHTQIHEPRRCNGEPHRAPDERMIATGTLAAVVDARNEKHLRQKNFSEPVSAALVLMRR
jgi:hypothetical protein